MTEGEGADTTRWLDLWARGARYLSQKCAGVVIFAVAGCGSLIQKNHHTDFAEPSGFKLSSTLVARGLVRSTVGATMRAPVASTRTGTVMLRDRSYALVRGGIPDGWIQRDKSSRLPAQAGGEEFEAYLDGQQLPAMTTGSVKFLVDGKIFFDELFNEIDAAESRVDIQTYIFDNDPFAVRIADVLKEKSRDVPVRVYFDALGSEVAGVKAQNELEETSPPGPVIHRYLQQDSNVQVRRFLNPWLVADHSKLHLIDQRIAYIGGINLGIEYLDEWHDMMARVEGPVVSDLVDHFESRWRSADWMHNWGLKWTRRRDRELPGKERDSSRDVPLRVLVTDPSIGKRDVLKATLIALRSASRRVWIQTPYFSSDEITSELMNALRRGVDVRVVIPTDNDTWIMEAVNMASLEGFAKAGGKVYTYPGMTHLKATVIDDWATFGSSNYDTLSLLINRELNLASSHSTVVAGLIEKIFLPDFRKSRLLKPEKLSRLSLGPAVELIGDQL